MPSSHWQNMPATSETNFGDFQWRAQFVKAVMERENAGFGPVGYWPNQRVRTFDPIEEYVGADMVPPLSPNVGDAWIVLDEADYEPNPTYIYSLGDDPPETPQASGYYGIKDSPTGAWQGHPNMLAMWHANGEYWSFRPPARTYCMYSSPAGYHVFREGQWADVGANQWRGNGGMVAEWDGTGWTFREPLSESGYYYKAGNRYYAHGSSAPKWRELLAVANTGYSSSGSVYGVVDMQETLEELVYKFARPSATSWDHIFKLPYKLVEFWEDLGVPADYRPDEDTQLCNSPPYMPDADENYAGLRIAVQNPAEGDFEEHDGEIAAWSWDSVEEEWIWTFETPPDGYRIARIGSSNPFEPLRTNYWTFGGYYRRDAATNSWVSMDDAEIGWKRVCPREINTPDDEGQTGQRARLTGQCAWTFNKTHPYSSYRTWYLFDVSTDPPEDPPDCSMYAVGQGATGIWEGHDGEIAQYYGGWSFTMPENGKAYPFACRYTVSSGVFPSKWLYQNEKTVSYLSWGGQWVRLGPGYDMYEHNGSQWVLSEDQTSPPDLVETHGRAQHGDYMTADLFNELYAAINLLHRRGIGGGDFVNTACKRVYSYAGTEEESKSQTLAKWHSEEPGSWSTFPEAWSRVSYTEQYHRYWSYLCRYGGQYESGHSGGGQTNNVNVEYHVIAQPCTSHYEKVFDDYGSGARNGTSYCWERQTNVPAAHYYTSTDTFDGDMVNPPTPWAALDTIRGHEVVFAFVIEENAIEGGFEYW